ncbi:microtubule-associated protein futsch isoform X3 [Anoplophora glabripennis]|uniref:microtubule-associated protein futsch isoform X3 n=1 Tax=Anoplophora glabripennis TaxID=217634 RepID=UPI00087463B4|nr:microtubule-associated protein futsch isoform X3 [Anoplophora glabripennis]
MGMLRTHGYYTVTVSLQVTSGHVASKRRFWNPKKWFKRKNKVTEDVAPVEVTEIGKDALRSRSTSELSVADDVRRRSSSSMHPGLSVSHDSVFHSPNSGSDMELDAAQSSSSLSISQPLVDSRLQTELSERLRLRRGRGDTSEDDEGLPHSPCNSPTTSDGLLLDKTAIKDLPTKSHSTCSDGSLLSMGSYEMDEDSFGPHSRHSSKLSLHEKKPNPDSDLEFGPSSIIEPLNHSAAHHRVSVRPKRTYGAPRRKRGQQLSSALPVTPEVNEESSIRSISPESNRKETITELYSMTTTRTLTDTQLKCSSLPPGLTAPGAEIKLNRSKSNAGSKSQDHFSPLHEDAEKEEKPSLFERIFPRKSGRKKKSKDEKDGASKHDVKVTREETVHKHEEVNKNGEYSREERLVNVSSSICHTENYKVTSVVGKEASKPIPAPRSGAASRQRVIPIDIPASPDDARREFDVILPKPSPEKSIDSTSPLQQELENRFKQRQISLSTSPKPSETPPQSPRSQPSPTALPSVISSTSEFSHYTKTSSTTVSKHQESRTRSEEIRNKMKIPGLSSLQQRVLSLNDDETNNGFLSLTDFTSDRVKPSKPITKSHSFKSTKQTEEKDSYVRSPTGEFKTRETKEDNRVSFTKAASLDSIKNLEEQSHYTEFKLALKPPAAPEVKCSNDKSDVKTDKDISENKSDTSSDLDVFRDSITISGPSHTAVVNVTSHSEDFVSNASKMISNSSESSVVEKDGSKTISVKENQVSVTKIQLKRETTQVTQSTITLPKSSVPEFLNKQLNKVEARPSSNIIFSMKSPRITEEQNRPKTLFNFEAQPEVITKPPTSRKFSKEDLEIIEKDSTEEISGESPKSPSAVTVTSSAPQSNRFKKNEVKSNSRKSSVVSITPESPVKEKPPLFKNKSASLDSLKNESDRSSQDSLDKLEEKPKEKTSPTTENVVLRRKSVANKKNDEEPELMKVFARRSLKLKDSDVDSIQETLADNKLRDSDKENQVDSPVDDRKKWYNKPKELSIETDFSQRRKSLGKQENVDSPKSPVKEPLTETRIPDSTKNAKEAQIESPVALRRNINNNIFVSQRAVSLNPPKPSESLVKKQPSFSERRLTEQWMSKIKNLEPELKEKGQEEIISSNFITESKNFNQRKAEWEKRAQQAQKKTTP